jgi:DNA-directed RNA polymerase subunit RPC12/RpoP
MIAVRCPGCGRPCHVSLARADEITCAACGYAGAPPREAAAALEDARTALGQTRVELRQIDRRRRAELEQLRGRLANERLGIIVAALFSAATVTLATGYMHRVARVPGFHLVEAVPAFVSALALTWVGARRVATLRHLLSDLEEPWAAHVPSTPGAPAVCYVCGAPVDVAGARSIARCEYCGADNLVDRAVLARMRGRQHLVVEGLGEATVAAATALSNLSLDVQLWSRAVLFVMPALSPALVVLCFLLLDAHQGAIDPGVRYVLDRDEVTHHDCLRAVSAAQQAASPFAVDPGSIVGRSAEGPADSEEDPPDFELPGFRPVRPSGRVVSVSGNPLFGNRASLERDAREERVSLDGLCLAPVR